MPRPATTLLPSLQRLLTQLGENIHLARLRRKLTASLVAERAAISRKTLWQIEHGDPNVTLGSYASVLQALSLQHDLISVAADDELGRKLQDLGLTLPKSRLRRPLMESNRAVDCEDTD
jgi:transcriptional regulator with XRE-family HTH domain